MLKIRQIVRPDLYFLGNQLYFEATISGPKAFKNIHLLEAFSEKTDRYLKVHKTIIYKQLTKASKQKTKLISFKSFKANSHVK